MNIHEGKGTWKGTLKPGDSKNTYQVASHALTINLKLFIEDGA